MYLWARVKNDPRSYRLWLQFFLIERWGLLISKITCGKFWTIGGPASHQHGAVKFFRRKISIVSLTELIETYFLNEFEIRSFLIKCFISNISFIPLRPPQNTLILRVFGFSQKNKRHLCKFVFEILLSKTRIFSPVSNRGSFIIIH